MGATHEDLLSRFAGADDLITAVQLRVMRTASTLLLISAVSPRDLPVLRILTHRIKPLRPVMILMLLQQQQHEHVQRAPGSSPLTVPARSVHWRAAAAGLRVRVLHLQSEVVQCSVRA